MEQIDILKQTLLDIYEILENDGRLYEESITPVSDQGLPQVQQDKSDVPR
jgi:hypothetical protein